MERGDKERKRHTNKMKNTKVKYYIGEVEEQHGEYKHTTKYLFKTAGDQFDYADKVSKKWYGHDGEDVAPALNGGYWQNGEIVSSVGEVKKISPEHFKILKKYLSVL